MNWIAPVMVSLSLVITAPPSAGQFTVHPDRYIGDEPFAGFGVQMNPYVYCAPNWGDVTEENVKDLERKIIDLAPQHVRIFTLLYWWTPQGDPRIARGDPRMLESFIRTVRMAQRAGATVNLTLWYGPWPEPEKSGREFAQVLHELTHEHDLHAIQYVTLQNEVNYTRITMETYNRLYRAFHDELIRLGLRDRIRIIGGDLVAHNQRAWFANLAEHQHDLLDGYSVHMYWNYWDTERLLQRVSEVPEIVAELPPEGRKPLYVMEFGVRGHRPEPRIEPGYHEDGTPIAETPVQAMQIAWFMLEAINRGYLATVQWDAYDVSYGRSMQFGVIGGVKDGWPLKPAYHVLRLFTHTAGAGWRAVEVEGAAEELLTAAMRGPEGQLTTFILNRSHEARAVSVAGLPQDRTLHVITWNGDGEGRLDPPRRVDPGEDARITVPPMGLAALTTAAPDFE